MSEPEAREALREALDRLYATFRRYRLRRQIDGCPCCVRAEDQARIRKSLLGLTGDDLERYTWKAMTTWGDAEDFKHFLPRILDLLAFDPGRRLYPEIVLSKLSLAGWCRWPAGERAAVEAYLLALWRFVLSAFPSPAEGLCAEDLIQDIAQAVEDLDPYLRPWRSDRSAAAVRHLARLVLAYSHALTGWVRDPARQGVLSTTGQWMEWLLDPSTSEAIEWAFFDEPPGPPADELAGAADWLYWLHAADDAPRRTPS